MNASEIQIVVYQTNEIVRLDVHLKNETVKYAEETRTAFRRGDSP